MAFSFIASDTQLNDHIWLIIPFVSCLRTIPIKRINHGQHVEYLYYLAVFQPCRNSLYVPAGECFKNSAYTRLNICQKIMGKCYIHYFARFFNWDN